MVSDLSSWEYVRDTVLQEEDRREKWIFLGSISILTYILTLITIQRYRFQLSIDLLFLNQDPTQQSMHQEFSEHLLANL